MLASRYERLICFSIPAPQHRGKKFHRKPETRCLPPPLAAPETGSAISFSNTSVDDFTTDAENPMATLNASSDILPSSNKHLPRPFVQVESLARQEWERHKRDYGVENGALDELMQLAGLENVKE